MPKSRKSRKIIINAPKYHYPGKGRPREELAYISPREKRGLLNSTDHTAEMTRHGVLSFADDTANHPGSDSGNPGYSGGNFGNTGALGGNLNSGSTPAGTRGGTTNNSNRSTSGQSSTSSSANHSNSNSGSGDPGSGSKGSGSSQGKSNNAATGASNYGGGPSTSNNAGQNRGNESGMGSNDPGSRQGGQNVGGQNPAQGPSQPGMSTPGSTQGGLLGRNPAVGPSAPGMSTPGALLNATRAPKSINDRIGPERPEDRDPLADARNMVPGSITAPPGKVSWTAPGYENPPKSFPNVQTPEFQADILRAKKRQAEGTLKPDMYNSYFGYTEPTAPKPTTPISENTIQANVDWAREYLQPWSKTVIDPAVNPKAAKYGTTALGADQVVSGTLLAAAKRLGMDPATQIMDKPTQDALSDEVSRMKQEEVGDPIAGWEGFKGRLNPEGPKLAADAKAAVAKGALDATRPDPNAPRNLGTNLRDPVATGGFDYGDTPEADRRAAISEGILGRAPATFSGGVPERPFSDNLPSDTRISPAGGPEPSKIQDRVAQDPNFDPARGNLLSERLRTTSAINDPLGDFSFSNRKAIRDQVPESEFNPNALQPETENEPVSPANQRILNALTREPNTTRHAVDLVDRRQGYYDPTTLANLTNPEVITPQRTVTPRSRSSVAGNYSPDLATSTEVPGPGSRPSPAFNQTGRGSDQQRPPVTFHSPNIPVHAEVQNAVVQQYGEEEGTDILATVAAVKQAMGTTPRRGRGIGTLVSAPRKGKRRNTNIPEDAPRLGA